MNLLYVLVLLVFFPPCNQAIAEEKTITLDKETCSASGILGFEPDKYIKSLDMIAIAKIESSIIKDPDYGIVMVKTEKCHIIPLTGKRKNESEIHMTVIMDVTGFEAIFLESETVKWYIFN